MEQNGRPYQGEEISSFIEPDGTTISTSTSLLGTRYDTAELSLNYVFSTLNRGLFANQGMRHLLSFTYVPPGLDVRYMVASYKFSGYLPITHGWTLSENAQIS